MLTLLDFPLSGRENTSQESACHHPGTQLDITGNTITALHVILPINILERMEKETDVDSDWIKAWFVTLLSGNSDTDTQERLHYLE